MTIDEINKVLKTSFKNGVYIRRPHFSNLEIYINKDGKSWQIEKFSGKVFETDLMEHEYKLQDWEII